MRRIGMLGVGKSAGGYTIVEALIFLAVSGALLVSAGTVISGRQEKTRFNQGFEDITQNLQDVFNDASTGYYPSADDISCATAGGPPATTLTISSSAPGVNKQGQNSACVFGGKLIQFPINTSTYNIYTMVANRDGTSLSTSIIKLLGIGGTPGLSDTKTNNIDLRTTKIIQSATLQEYGSIVVLSDFGNTTGTTVSGNAGKLKLYGYLPGVGTGPINTNSSQLVPITGTNYIAICLEQDTATSKKGSITITPQLTLDRQIGASRDALC